MATMAKPSPNAGQPDGQKAQSDRAALMLVGVFALLGLFVFSLPTVIVLFIGMLPSLVAIIIDRSEERYAAISVTSMNFCGVFPSILELWTNDHTIAAASNTVTDVFSLAVMFGAAAFGWMIYSSVPPVIAQFLAQLAQRRVNILQAQQRKIVDEWGPSVAGDHTVSTDEQSDADDDGDGDGDGKNDE